MTNAREISVEYLARVEGEGSMRVKVVDDKRVTLMEIYRPRMRLAVSLVLFQGSQQLAGRAIHNRERQSP